VNVNSRLRTIYPNGSRQLGISWGFQTLQVGPIRGSLEI
jgi:hypothetical protein